MAKKIKIRVVKLVELLDARARVEAGDFEGGAAYLTAFCDRNGAMRSEHGVEWGDVKIAAHQLRQLVEGEIDKARLIIGKLWRTVFPKLTEKREAGARAGVKAA